MKAFFARLAGWFTDTRRAALQAFITSTLTLLAALGQISGEQSAAVATLAASVLIAVQGGIGLALLRPSDLYTWFDTTGRAAIYGVAAALGPVGVSFALWGPESSEQFVALATVLASILAAFVQVVNTQTLAPARDLGAEARDNAAEVLESFSAAIDGAAWAEWVPPFSGLRVGVLAVGALRGQPHADVVRELLAPERVESVVYLHHLEDFRGRTFDVVLTSVPLTRALLEAIGPAVSTSSLPVGEDRVRYLG